MRHLRREPCNVSHDLLVYQLHFDASSVPLAIQSVSFLAVGAVVLRVRGGNSPRALSEGVPGLVIIVFTQTYMSTRHCQFDCSVTDARSALS